MSVPAQPLRIVPEPLTRPLVVGVPKETKTNEYHPSMDAKVELNPTTGVPVAATAATSATAVATPPPVPGASPAAEPAKKAG